MVDPSNANRAKSARHRDKLREQGQRPVQFSLPDTRTQEFMDEAHRQCLNIVGDMETRETVTFLRAIAAWR